MGSPEHDSTPAVRARRGLGTRRTARCSSSSQSFRSTAHEKQNTCQDLRLPRQTFDDTAPGSYLQQHSAVGVHIGPGVLGLTLLQQHIWDNLVELGDQFEHGVVGKVLHGKLPLAGVTWVGLPQDSVSVTRHNLATIRRYYSVESKSDLFFYVGEGGSRSLPNSFHPSVSSETMH